MCHEIYSVVCQMISYRNVIGVVKKSLISGENIGIWKHMVDGYKEFVDCSEHPKAAEALCEAHMNVEIAHRFFKIINMSNDLCELFGVKRDDRE